MLADTHTRGPTACLDYMFTTERLHEEQRYGVSCCERSLRLSQRCVHDPSSVYNAATCKSRNQQRKKIKKGVPSSVALFDGGVVEIAVTHSRARLFFLFVAPPTCFFSRSTRNPHLTQNLFTVPTRCVCGGVYAQACRRDEQSVSVFELAGHSIVSQSRCLMWCCCVGIREVSSILCLTRERETITVCQV